MITTEEIVVVGEEFIERQIFVGPSQGEIENLQHSAYTNGYKSGWTRGFWMGLVLVGVAALVIWLAVQW